MAFVSFRKFKLNTFLNLCNFRNCYSKVITNSNATPKYQIYYQYYYYYYYYYCYHYYYYYYYNYYYYYYYYYDYYYDDDFYDY